MAGNVGSGDDPLVPIWYRELICPEEVRSLETNGCFGLPHPFSSSSERNRSPKMLCFGDYAKQCNEKTLVENESKPDKKPGTTSTVSSSLISSTNDAASPKSINKKRVGSETQYQDTHVGVPTGSQRSGKKSRSDASTVAGSHAKGVKKEKLGERITALQQLVSPFGKTDTASVLHEAFGYIRFLQDQVQVLCSPYLQCLPSSSSAVAIDTPTDNGGESVESERRKLDLRSRGLCLVPIDFTLHVAESNGADLWSSAAISSTR